MPKKKQIPTIQGTKVDGGFKGMDYCDEWCSYCGGETFNVPANTVSLCAHCGAELFPCSACEDKCDWNTSTNRCHRFCHSKKWKNQSKDVSVGDKVITNSQPSLVNKVGTIIEITTNVSPKTQASYTVDFEEDGICILDKDSLAKYHLPV